MNFYIRELEMVAQLQQAQNDEKAIGADGPDEAQNAISAADSVPTGGVILPVQRTDAELTAEEQKSRLAKAEAMYGAIAEAVEAAEDPNTKVSRRA